jgi:lipopolysaccharide transport system ATP-binding protein
MGDTVITVEHLYKEYKLGVISHGTLTRDLQSWWARVRGREDPNSLISVHHREDTEKDSFLALNDVSFEVKQGDRVGIIGKNGAGKSTLLKILSRITSPTKGMVKIKGRVGSLLEVGTGFHPELTGRENIYLNGAILGMTRHEISRKLDEIVDFAGIEKYLDTPVKRYSSGMNVRLGFAVAAHLDTDILIVDEVLAVGDVQFQKKCLGKMEEISQKEKRTILFVSHNMLTIKQLCSTGFYLQKGKIVFQGKMNQVIEAYYRDAYFMEQQNISSFLEDKNGKQLTFTRTCIKNQKGEETNLLAPGEPITVEIHYFAKKRLNKPCFGVQVNALAGNGLFTAAMIYDALSPDYIEGLGVIACRFTDIVLMPQRYSITLRAQLDAGLTILADTVECACTFNVLGHPIEYGMKGENALKFVESEDAPVLCNYEWIYNDGTTKKQRW